MIKHSILFIAVSLITFTAFAQSKDSLPPPYLRTKEIPPFSLQRTDERIYTKAELPQKKLYVIIYFDAACNHCQVLTRNLVDSIALLQNTAIVMGCYNKLRFIEKFEEEYKLKNIPNIIVGRDKDYFLVPFFRLKYTPFVAIYNNQGNLVKAYPDNFSVKELLQFEH